MMMSLVIYLILSLIILIGIIRDPIRYAIISPYIFYGSYIVYYAIARNFDLDFSIFQEYTVVPYALLIQSLVVIFYLTINVMLYPTKVLFRTADNQGIKLLIKNLEKILITVSFLAILVLIVYRKNFFSFTSIDYIQKAEDIRNIPYFSFLVNFNNSLYCFLWLRGIKLSRVTFIFFLIPNFLISVLGIRLFLVKIVWLLIITNARLVIVDPLLNIRNFLFMRLSLKKLLITILILLSILTIGVLSVFLLYYRSGEKFEIDLALAIFQEPVFDVVGFLQALQKGATTDTLNIVQCSLFKSSSNEDFSCYIHGAFGITSIWAEVFSYEESYIMILLMCLTFAVAMSFLYNQHSRGKSPIFSFFIASIISSCIDIWRGSFWVGFLMVFKNIVGFGLIRVFLYVIFYRKKYLKKT